MEEQVMVDQSRDQPHLRLEENCHFHSTRSFRLRPDSTLEEKVFTMDIVRRENEILLRHGEYI